MSTCNSLGSTPTTGSHIAETSTHEKSRRRNSVGKIDRSIVNIDVLVANTW
jgi:hypothetical protein